MLQSHQLNHFYYKSLPWLTPRRFRHPLSDIDIIKPIFLLGTQGGGLTLLSRILHRSQNAVYCNGNADFWAGRDEMQNVGFRHLPKELRLGTAGDYDIIHPEASNAGGFLYATDECFDDFRLTEKDYTPENAFKIRNLIKTYIRAYAKDIQAARFIDKSQSYSLKVPWLKKCFPDAKFVIFSRNPYAICSRNLSNEVERIQKGWNRPNLTQERLLSLKSQHWLKTFETLFSDLKKEEHVFMPFETFLENPKDSLKTILNYCELPWDENLLPAKHHTVPRGSVSLEKWFPMQKVPNQKHLEGLNDLHKDIIASIVNPLAKTMGYKIP